MLIYAILFSLVYIAITIRRDNTILFTRISIIILIYCSIIGLLSINIIYLDKGISLYGGLYLVTSNTQIFQVFILILSKIILMLTGFYPLKNKVQNTKIKGNTLVLNINTLKKIINKKQEQFKIIEYPLIILFIITGSLFLLTSNDLISVFLSIELQSYGLYILSTIYRNSELATSAGLTYFLLGGLSSCFLLLATALLYANSGTTSLDNIYIITSLTEITNTYNNEYNIYKPTYLNVSLLIMSVGFLFKISAAPFHFWSPEVYDGIPTKVTTFVAIISKIAILMFFLELVYNTNNNFFYNQQYSWNISLLISSLLSLIIGTILGLTQFRIKRLYAYSTISHLGFILLALSINSLESIQAYIFYIMQYSISNLNAFIILISIGYTVYYYVNNKYSELLDKNNSPIQLISQLKGYFWLNPVLAISLAITLFSFVGVPPLLGFFAKQMVLSAALNNNYIFLSLIAILTSVISAAYYLGVIKHIFLDKIEYFLHNKLKNKVYVKKSKYFFTLQNDNFFILSNSLTITISIFTLIILLFILMPQEWLSLANVLAIKLYNA